MIKSGIINEKEVIELENNDLIPYLYNLIDKSTDSKNAFEIYKQNQFFWSDLSVIDYFVKVLGFVIIYDKVVYFQSEVKSELIDKIDYIKNGFQLKKLPKMIYKNGKFIKYLSSIQQEIEIAEFEHSINPENDLSFWYPRTANIGFKTPNTIITNFTDVETNLIKTGKWNNLCEKDLLKRIRIIAKQSGKLDLSNEMFIRLGNSSNKFNFDSCHINEINELYQKLMIMFDDMYFKLEWQQSIELVLREYIKTNYQRNRIYNGMPLNTEFRVFYDFDKNRILGIFNYWEKDTMLDNLHNNQDLITFANTTHEIECDFNNLSPFLKKEAEYKLPNADLKGKWSVDFLYDGKEFILIDMAHAECSYYYDKVLSKQRTLK